MPIGPDSRQILHYSTWTWDSLPDEVGERVWPTLCGAVVDESDMERHHEATIWDTDKNLAEIADSHNHQVCESCLAHPKAVLIELSKTELE